MKKKKGNSALEDMARKANEAGMTYGQYQTMKLCKSIHIRRTKDNPKKVKQYG